MLLPWSCLSPLSVVRVCTYSRHNLVRGFSCYHPGLVRAHRQLSESACILAVISVRIQGRSSDLDMWFTDCHSNCDFRTISSWNEFSQFSIDCIPITNHQTNIYYTHEQLHVFIVVDCLRIPPCGSRCFPISTIDWVYPVHMYREDHFLDLWLDSFPLFE